MAWTHGWMAWGLFAITLLAAPAHAQHVAASQPMYGADATRLAAATTTRGSRRTYYVDCSASARGDGSRAAPWNRLASANAVALEPGDALAFRRGTTCKGQLTIHASGTAATPIRIGSYGHGPAARIDANGQPAAIRLRNAAYVTVQDLELTAPGDGRTPRRGVWVQDVDGGDLPGIVLQRLDIHDVRGIMPATRPDLGLPAGKYARASGGIIMEALGVTRPSAFIAPVIRDNDIHDVGREGIYLWSNWCMRPQLVSFWSGVLCTAPWHPIERPVIENNRLRDIGGDGIALMTVVDARVDHNTLEGFNQRAQGYNAGMWSANSVDAVFTHNATSGGTGTMDGMAYDVDHSSQGTVFKYNLSHDNEGGFFLICPYGVGKAGAPEDFVIARNLSIHDHVRTFQICANGGVDSGVIAHNTIVLPRSDPGTHHLIWTAKGLPEGAVTLHFSHNRWIGSDADAALEMVWASSSQTTISGDHELYYRVPPMPSGDQESAGNR